ncbi:MAG: tripartite tricarboxylate transporter substrate binding protein [Planctomycetota bacterium]|jgi:tripartite-type tricarboxylate transporter receptor subunit TctC
MSRPVVHSFLIALIVLFVGADVWSRTRDVGAEYPGRPIKLVVPFNPGGGSDTFARIIKAGIDEHNLLPHPLVIINRPGGSSTIGSRYVRDARPDGYTLLMLHDALITAKYSGTVTYGPEAFEPVAGTGKIDLVVAVHEDSPYETLNDLLDAAEATPNEIVYGVNMGAPSHFLALRLEGDRPGAKFRYTQAGDGTDRLQKLVGGHIHAATFSATEYLNFREKGLRGLAIFDEVRRASLPELPTAVGQGVDVVEVNMQYWWLPKKTPQDRVDYLADVLRRAIETDTVRAKLEELQMEPRFLAGDEHRANLVDRENAAASVGAQPKPDLPDFPTLVGGALVVLLGAIAIDRKSLDRVAAVPLSTPAIKRVVGLLGLTVLAVLAMSFGIPFAWTACGFIFLAGIVLSTARPNWLVLAETALLVSFGIQFLLTHVVVTDLP